MADKEFLELRKKIIEKDFQHMNDKQKQAIFQVKGPVLILAGAIGNMVDSMFYGMLLETQDAGFLMGKVVDMIHLPLFKWENCPDFLNFLVGSDGYFFGIISYRRKGQILPLRTAFHTEVPVYVCYTTHTLSGIKHIGKRNRFTCLSICYYTLYLCKQLVYPNEKHEE